MLDVKKLLETTELKVKENMFVKAPAYPYIIFTDRKQYNGADECNMLVDRYIVIELYSDKPDQLSERLIENAIDSEGLEWEELPREYIDSETHYMKTYNLNFREKRGI